MSSGFGLHASWPVNDNSLKVTSEITNKEDIDKRRNEKIREKFGEQVGFVVSRYKVVEDKFFYPHLIVFKLKLGIISYDVKIYNVYINFLH